MQCLTILINGTKILNAVTTHSGSTSTFTTRSYDTGHSQSHRVRIIYTIDTHGMATQTNCTRFGVFSDPAWFYAYGRGSRKNGDRFLITRAPKVRASRMTALGN